MRLAARGRMAAPGLPALCALWLAASAAYAGSDGAVDPRDFTGVYGRVGGPMVPMPRRMPVQPGELPARPAAPAPAAAATRAPDSMRDNRMNCVPENAINGGNPYALMMISTPGRLTTIDEFNHIVRRISIDRAMPARITPSYAGYSVGRWDGDTLVVETRGIRDFRMMGGALRTLDHVQERIRRSADGRQVERVARFVGWDADGQGVALESTFLYQQNPGQRLFEFICEEGAGDFNRP